MKNLSLKNFCLFFFLCLSAPIFSKSTCEVLQNSCSLIIETPDLADQKIRKIRLENGLEALLISDPKTHESGAALAVEIGSWDDPENRPGMAHFVEHLLFLGTKKYPDEEGYTRYLNEHGGKQNAFTMSDRTVYMFSINNTAFLEALDRFGQFFVAPLFSPSGVDRESKAIHQEYCKDQPLDTWRILFVKKELANKKHPFHSFCIGNQETLAKISQDELKKWYCEHYSSNLMHLVVYSPLDLDTLEKEVATIFSEIKNLDRSPARCSEALVNLSSHPTLCAIKPLQDLQLLDLSWEIPRFYGQDKSMHADKLLAHVLGHEGENSLLAQLKRESLAENLAAGSYRAGNDQCLFTLSIYLTAKGIKEYETVIQRVYETLASLKESGIPRYLFDEVSQLEQLRYRFQSRHEIFQLVSDYAMGMVDEPLETFPEKTLIPSIYSPENILELLTFLIPRKCQYTLVAPPHLSDYTPSVKERWLGVDYSLIPLGEQKLKQWSKALAHPNITVPRPNPFIPVELTIKKPQTNIDEVRNNPIPIPSLIADEPLGKVYAKADTRFLIPEISWNLTFKTPAISDANPLSHVYADLFCHCVNEKLNSISYEAMSAGLHYTLEPKHGALELKIQGYSDKADRLLKTVVEAMKKTVPSQEEFSQYYDQINRDYLNKLNKTPLKQGGDLLWSILYKHYPSLHEKAEAIKNSSFNQVRIFCSHLFERCYVEATFFGNQTLDQCQENWKSVKSILRANIYPTNLHPKIELATLPGNDAPLYLSISSQLPSNALILTADCGRFSFKRRAAQEILAKGLEEPFFSELRTRQQTAYIVANWAQELERRLYTFFAIQSSSHDSRDLLSRFELFIESSLQHLSDMVIPQDRFEMIREAHIHNLKHPAESLAKMGSLLHKLAFHYDGDFAWIEKQRQAAEELTYEEFIDFANTFLGRKNLRRFAICINGKVPQEGWVSYREITTPEQLKDEISYESREDPYEGHQVSNP